MSAVALAIVLAFLSPHLDLVRCFEEDEPCHELLKYDVVQGPDCVMCLWGVLTGDEFVATVGARP